MTVWMVLATAFANDFGRQDERLRAHRYVRLHGEGPVYGRTRSRRGAFVVTHFPDYQAEHVDEFAGRTLVRTTLYDATGKERAAVDWEARVVQWPVLERTTSFLEWTEVTVGSIVLHAPPLTEQAADHWKGSGVVIARQARADPFSEDFAAELQAGCGCEIEARITTWIAGRPAAHFRLQRPDETADLVALPTRDALWVFTTAGPDLGALIPLRAMMATARPAP